MKGWGEVMGYEGRGKGVVKVIGNTLGRKQNKKEGEG